MIPNDKAELVLKQPRYRIKTKENGWLPWMMGLASEDGDSDDFAGTKGSAAIGFEIDWNGGAGWFVLRTKDKPGGLDKNLVGDGSPLVGVTIYYDTLCPEQTGWCKAKYRVSPVGGDYLKWEYDNEDAYAGDGKTPFDRIQLTVCNA